jgi:hypothetical protein
MGRDSIPKVTAGQRRDPCKRRRTSPTSRGRAMGRLPGLGLGNGLEDELRRDRDGRVQRSVNGTGARVKGVHLLRDIAMLLRRAQVQSDVNAPDDQDVTVELYLPFRERLESARCRRDFARLQRAPEGSGQSTGSRGDDVVEGRGVRILIGSRLVVLGDRAVHAEEDRLSLGWKIRPSQGTLLALDAHLGSIDDVCHCSHLEGEG